MLGTLVDMWSRAVGMALFELGSLSVIGALLLAMLVYAAWDIATM